MRSGLLTLAERTARRLPERARLALYRLGPISRGLRAALNRAAPHGVHPVQVAAGDLAGMWLLLDLQVDKDLWLGTYEPDVAAAIRDYLSMGSIAYDVGANVGYTTLLMARAVGPHGKVVAFEPLPSNVARLSQAIAVNQLGSRVEVVPAAVSDRDGTASFAGHVSGSMGRLVEQGEGPAGPQSTTVDVVRLDSLVFGRGTPAPALIKIDVEGGEASVLRGMPRLLREARPTLLIEVHGREATEATFDELARAGYQVLRMQPGAALPATIEDVVRTRHLVGVPAGGRP